MNMKVNQQTKLSHAIWCNFRLWIHVYEFAASSKVKVQGTTMPIYDIMTLTAMHDGSALSSIPVHDPSALSYIPVHYHGSALGWMRVHFHHRSARCMTVHLHHGRALCGDDSAQGCMRVHLDHVVSALP